MTVYITPIDKTWIHIDAELDILRDLDTEFQFMVDGAQFNPMVKARIWNGIIHTVFPYKKRAYAGLHDAIVKSLNDSGHNVESTVTSGKNITPEFVDTVFEKLNMYTKKGGTPLEIRDYQKNGVYEVIKRGRAIVVSPTGSGKSAMIYAISRMMCAEKKITLIVVPSIGLVSQMKGDFKDYSGENGWDAENRVQTISGGSSTNVTCPVVVATWQTLRNLPNEWFAKFGALIVDEAHEAAAKSISTITSNCVNASVKAGFTGSLDKTKTNKMMLHALFGPPVQVATTRTLMEKNQLADVDIKVIILNYSKETSRETSRLKYAEEVQYLAEKRARTKFICKLAGSIKGNTLIFFQLVRHGQEIVAQLAEQYPERIIKFIDGSTTAEEREAIRTLTENNDGVIIVASYGTTSRGVNIRRLHNLIFASPTKSYVRVVQSMGRGTRQTEGKDKFTLYDIADKLSMTKTPNFTYEHCLERLKIYSTECHSYEVKEVAIER